MREKVQMSIKEAERLGAMRQIDKKTLTVQKGNEQFGLCLRQMKRVRKQYLNHGEKGLISQKKNKPSNRKIFDEICSRAVELLKIKYVGFGPTLSGETLKKRERLGGYTKEESDAVVLESFSREMHLLTPGLKNEEKNVLYCSLWMMLQATQRQLVLCLQKQQRAILIY